MELEWQMDVVVLCLGWVSCPAKEDAVLFASQTKVASLDVSTDQSQNGQLKAESYQEHCQSLERSESQDHCGKKLKLCKLNHLLSDHPIGRHDLALSCDPSFAALQKREMMLASLASNCSLPGHGLVLMLSDLAESRLVQSKSFLTCLKRCLIHFQSRRNVESRSQSCWRRLTNG